jgi:formylglycine-generating enzyme required for sulfatase activity
LSGNVLPTEVEWEKAATWESEANANGAFRGAIQRHRPSSSISTVITWERRRSAHFPAGASAAGCLDMGGNVWEWTSTTFDRYPGFASYPYPEYSELWFDGDHRVLKGGSWMTSAPLLRASFRNFFRPGFRYAFAGFRCAADD